MSFVDVCDRTDMDELLRDLARHSNTTLTIDIAPETEVLAEPGEYEQLFNAAQSHSVDIELITDDPIRQELARIFGVKAVTTARSEGTGAPGPSDRTIVSQPMEASNTRPVVDRTEEISLGETEEIDLSGVHTAFDRAGADASFSFVTASAAPQSSTYRRRAAARRGARDNETTRSLRAASLVVSGALIVGAIVALLVALLAPTAAIMITPEVREISFGVTYGLAGSAEVLDVVIEPRPIEHAITFEASIGTTGLAILPDEPARGLIFLTNPHTDRVLVPEGTTFAADGHNVQYRSLADVEIPAADPFESARFGTAVVGIEAIEPGPEGNLDVGVLTGSIDSGVMFQNRFPLEGGSMKEVAVVATDDLEALKSMAIDGLQKQAPTALAEQVPDGWEYSEPPAMVGEPSFTFSSEAGGETETLMVQAEAVVAAAIFSPVELERSAREFLQKNLTAEVPVGFGLLVETIRISPPSQESETNLEPRTMTAVAQVEAQLDQETMDQLRSDAVGKRQAQLSEVLSGVPGVSEFELVYGPDWLPWEPIPRFPSRISIDVYGS